MARNILHGIPISGGIAIGKLVYMQHQGLSELPPRYIAYAEVAREKKRFTLAVDAAEQSFELALAALPDHLASEGEVIHMHKMLCRDPKLTAKANAYIEQKLLSAESALQRTLEEIISEFSEIEDDFFRETINDLRLVSERIMDKLTGRLPWDMRKGDPVILMARDLSPADTIELSLDNVLAMVTEDGGKTSHAGILARSMGIPAVVGVMGLGSTVRSGDSVIVDGLKGTILLHPTEEEKERYTHSAREYEQYKEKIRQKCQEPAEMTDGHQVEVLANVGWVEEIPKAIIAGAEGVGLYRTEYAFLNRSSIPDESELFKEYAGAVQALGGRSICFRTLDLGSDKQTPALELQNEANPALGLRATRYCLRNPPLFRSQLRALLRACARSHSSLMFPMVADLSEMRKIAHIVSEVRQELADQHELFARDINIGVMVELPSTVILADELAAEVDFFSIGTNDLTQYTLGVDRANAQVSHLYQPLHPAVLHSIKRVVDVAHQNGLPVSVCGEMAADPYCLPVLLGMPVDSVSMSAQAIPGIKSIIRQLSLEDCFNLVREVLKANTTSRVNRMVREFIYAKTKNDMSFHFSHLDGGYE